MYLSLALGIDVPFAKNPSVGTAQQRLFKVLKLVFYAIAMILEVLHLSARSRCCMAHL